MLTVKQINEVSFGKAGFSGYKPEDVDNFIDEVASSYEQLMNERDEAVKKVSAMAAQMSDMQAKMAVLAEKVESYRKDEDGIKDAILSAQRMSKGTVQEAKDKARLIIEDAQNDAKSIIESAKAEAAKASKEYLVQVDAKKNELEEMKRQVTAFRAALMEMYKKHLECIDHIPTFKVKETAEEAEQEQAESAGSVDQTEPEAVQEPVEEAAEVSQPAEEYVEEAVAQPVYEEELTLDDRVDYNSQPETDGETVDYYDDDLSEVGINTAAYADIPETLRREKSSNFSNLEFGDGVDVGKKRHKK